MRLIQEDATHRCTDCGALLTDSECCWLPYCEMTPTDRGNEYREGVEPFCQDCAKDQAKGDS